MRWTVPTPGPVLTRMATPETEAELVVWARDVSCGRIRHRADLATRTSDEEVRDVERDHKLAHE
jgi:hypothetical protein